MKKFSHIDAAGAARMVDVSAKPALCRHAVARAEIRLQPYTLGAIQCDRIPKGHVLSTARIAGIMAAKKTAALIPLCHPLSLTHCAVDFDVPDSRDRVVITASVSITAPTGVEMEALTAASIAALTIYDMCKAVDKTMSITGIKLVSKTKSEPPCK